MNIHQKIANRRIIYKRDIERDNYVKILWPAWGTSGRAGERNAARAHPHWYRAILTDYLLPVEPRRKGWRRDAISETVKSL